MDDPYALGDFTFFLVFWIFLKVKPSRNRGLLNFPKNIDAFDYINKCPFLQFISQYNQTQL